MVSSLYLHGPETISAIHSGIEKWMEQHHYQAIGDFRGKLSMGNTVNPAEYERVQFMKTFGEYK